MEIVDLPSYKMVIFHSFLYVYQRVHLYPIYPIPVWWPRYVEVSSEEEPELFFKDDQEFLPGGPRFGCQV